MRMFVRCLWITATLSVLYGGTPCLAADPEEAQYNVVVTLFNAGQWQAALKKIDERETKPLTDDMRAKYLYARGLALEAGKKNEDARKAYESLIQKYPLAPESARSRQALIFMDYANNDYRSVVSNCLTLKQDSFSPAERQKLAMMNAEACLALHDQQKALALYQQALTLGADRNVIVPKLFAIYQTLQMHKELIDLSAQPVPGVATDAVQMVRAESLLALGRNAEAEAEARKVQPASPFYPRAGFALAQSLIKQNKLKDAIAPLTTAIRDLKDPAPPPSAHLALAECLLADNRPADAEPALEAAAKQAAKLDAPEKKTLQEQVALVRIRIASALHDNRKIIQAVAHARTTLPADKLADALYARLFALHQEKDYAGILQACKEDLPVFQDKPVEGNALLIYFTACKQNNQLDEGIALLESFIRRKPNTAEAAKAKLELVNIALTTTDHARTQEQLRQLLAMPNLASHIGQDALVEAHYNAAAIALKLNDPTAAIGSLNNIRNQKPGKAMLGKSLLLLGQIHAQTNDWSNAAKAWNEALAQGDNSNEQDLRARLGRALMAAGKPAEAKAQFETLARTAGGTNRLDTETRETWARALYALSDYAGASAIYQDLYNTAGSTPVHAYESAVCLERAEKWTDAEKWYALAEQGLDKLPPDYARVIPQNLSRVRFKTGTGDQGFSYWIAKLSATNTDNEIEAALPVLARIAAGPTPPPAALDNLETLAKTYPTDNPRRYGVGAVALQLAATGDKDRMKKLATQLADDYAAAEKNLPAKKWSTTVAPAMIHFLKGEAERLTGNQADALIAYETVLAAYPFNEWPDAAACGAAECYATLGDTPTAIARLEEVAKSKATTGPSAKWIENAKKRLTELKQTKGDQK